MASLVNSLFIDFLTSLDFTVTLFEVEGVGMFGLSSSPLSPPPGDSSSSLFLLSSLTLLDLSSFFFPFPHFPLPFPLFLHALIKCPFGVVQPLNVHTASCLLTGQEFE